MGRHRTSHPPRTDQEAQRRAELEKALARTKNADIRQALIDEFNAETQRLKKEEKTRRSAEQAVRRSEMQAESMVTKERQRAERRAESLSRRIKKAAQKSALFEEAQESVAEAWRVAKQRANEEARAAVAEIWRKYHEQVNAL